MDKDKAALDRFGELLIKGVRDEAILDWDMIIDGRMKSPHAQHIRKFLAVCKDEQLDVLHKLVPDIVDTTIHHLLWQLEQVKWVDVAVTTEEGEIPSLRDVSDGLAGEMYSWRSRYSVQRSSDVT